ncbi:5-oxopent-3-ene-1,2,5-tricarboxylate decarboxylase [Pseudomonas ogarae]|uniref:Acylpyruvate hydrolase n=3 Tax=Pseudomonas TaxID=286 RepID=A0AAW8M988_9PSED|nr:MULTISPECIES: fumarylacetoacetate hydrolase family protein [Pseudomonas]KKA09916.1 5-oxopent-3-ene-1,2,5-tricarboxylate decarboxylase [Pseudomonas ogarae]MBO1537133.1 fumarylacetoacetate hydrolase family protein [Pseudomonas sp. OA65]MDR6958314.1 acylpyruvate hydrolase [Pseudomonas brassicacearum]QXI51436.1 fumarylacetoacetate hydrolase family protein [Pseudomonas alvandae]
MKLVNYESQGKLQPGILIDEHVFDTKRLLTAIGEDAPAQLTNRQLLTQWQGKLAALEERVVKSARANPETAVGQISKLRLGPPIHDSSKVLCVGLNYRDHVAETGRKLPSAPDIFCKFNTSLIGATDDIACTSLTPNLDFEGELAVVIGKPCRNVKPEEALDYVAGLTVLNDTSARDLQLRGTQWTPGKAIDGSTPCGPALVTLNEISNPQELDIQTRVNGEVMQSSNTSYQIFSIADVVSFISSFLELSPGDIIATGTPEGIGSKRTPPFWLKAGDVVEVEISEVGRLLNVVR